MPPLLGHAGCAGGNDPMADGELRQPPAASIPLGVPPVPLWKKARRQVAAALNAEPGEIYFTPAAPRADNWALRRYAPLGGKGQKHLITAVFEHHAVLHSAKALEKEGFEVTYLPVTADGLVEPAELVKGDP